MRCLFPCLLMTALGIGAVFGQGPKSAGEPQVSADRTIDQALELSGSNKGQLLEALERVPADHKAGMEYLIRYMPKRDLVTLDAGFLLANSAAAHAARNAHDWARDVPLEIFHNDVLPYALLDEKRENWRLGFRERFAPMVENCQSLREAAVVINKAIKDEVKVKYSTEREKANQSPSESMKSGLASCTGLSVLLCDAFRSVGIPARIVGTPSWTTKRGNHNWVEFYDPVTGKWHFTEYYPDSKGFDHGWMVADAAKGIPGDFAHAIYASSWKPSGKCFPLVWDMDVDYVAGLDVTERYKVYGKSLKTLAGDECELRIEFRDNEGKRIAAKCEVHGQAKRIANGVTPDAQADANEFFTVVVKRGGRYTVSLKDDSEKNVVVRPVEVGKDEEVKMIVISTSASG